MALRDDKLQKEACITLAIDGWSDCNNNSIYTTTATCGSDRSVYVLEALDVSPDHHTGSFLAGELQS